jgi:hypothetical protein
MLGLIEYQFCDNCIQFSIHNRVVAHGIIFFVFLDFSKSFFKHALDPSREHHTGAEGQLC